MTGYEQVRSVVAALAGDLDAAKRVELVLPETGICNSDFDEADYCWVSDRFITEAIYVPPQIFEENRKAIYLANAVIQGFH